jgi:hypothetical protein
MARLREYRPIEFRQVCAIARLVFLRAPGMTDAEWKDATKDACAQQGYDNPLAEMLAKAMGAVERAIEQTMGPRRILELDPPPTERAPDASWTAADYRGLADLVRRIAARSNGHANAPTNVTSIAIQRLDISEAAALDQFYAEASTGDRISALRRFAEVAIRAAG